MCHARFRETCEKILSAIGVLFKGDKTIKERDFSHALCNIQHTVNELRNLKDVICSSVSHNRV